MWRHPCIFSFIKDTSHASAPSAHPRRTMHARNVYWTDGGNIILNHFAPDIMRFITFYNIIKMNKHFFKKRSVVNYFNAYAVPTTEMTKKS